MEWKQLIERLVAAGVSQSDIHRATGLSKSCVTDLVKGRQKTTSWENGQALIALAAKHGVLQ